MRAEVTSLTWEDGKTESAPLLLHCPMVHVSFHSAVPGLWRWGRWEEWAVGAIEGEAQKVS